VQPVQRIASEARVPDVAPVSEAPDDDPTPSRTDRPRARASTIASVAASAAVLLVSFGVLDHLGRGRTFFYDEWDFVQHRSSGLVDPLLEPHNGHLSIVPVAVFRLLFETVGLDHYRPYRWVGLSVHVLVVVLVFLIVRRRAGAGVATAMAFVVLWLGPAWQDILWPFQIGFMGSVAAGLGAHLLLDHERRRSDVGAACFLAISLGCSSIGIPFVVGAAVRLAWERRWWFRLWVVGAPSALYGLWYLPYGESQAEPGNVDVLGSYVATSAAGAVGALADLTLDWGRIAAGVLLGVGAATIIRRRRCPAFVAGMVATALSFWVLTGLSRAHLGEPNASRYLYLGGIMVLIAAAGLLPEGHRIGRLGIAAIWVAAGLSVWANVAPMRAGASGLRSVSEPVSAELYVLELLADRAPPGYRPDPIRAPTLVVEPYLAAVHRHGSPAPSEDEVLTLGGEARREADRVLRELVHPEIEPSSETPGAACRSLTDGGAVTVAGARTLISAPGGSDLRLARFAAEFPTEPTATVPAGGTWALVLPPDDADVPWRVQVGPGATVCSSQ
jgi:hypothetical protein